MISAELRGEHSNVDAILISPERASRFVSDIDIPAKPQLLKYIDQLNGDINEVSDVIRCDPAMSAAVLKVVNSPWVGLPNPISKIEQAVVLLGTFSVKNIIRAICFRTLMEPIAEPKLIKRFWRSSLRTARCASLLARYLHLSNPDDAYVLGLFHNCGFPILSSHYLDVDNVVIQVYQEKEARFLALEDEAFGIDHAAIGARLSSAWGLPTYISDVIGRHHTVKAKDLELFSQTNNLLITLKLAEFFSHEHEVFGGCKVNHEWEKIGSVCMEYASLTNSDMQHLEQVCESAFSSEARAC